MMDSDEKLFCLVLILNEHFSYIEIYDFVEKIRALLQDFDAKNVSFIPKINRIVVSFEKEFQSLEAANFLSKVEHIKHILFLDPFSKNVGHLTLPPPQRLFLISPPPSPPENWESTDEKPPVPIELSNTSVEEMSYALIGKLAQPGETYQLIPQTTNTPGVILSTDKLLNEEN